MLSIVLTQYTIIGVCIMLHNNKLVDVFCILKKNIHQEKVPSYYFQNKN